MKERVYPREKYLSRLRLLTDSDIVKDITGIRRCGKSSILKSIIEELERRNIGDRIIYLPLDKRVLKKIKNSRSSCKDVITPPLLNIVKSEYKNHLIINKKKVKYFSKNPCKS